MGLQGFFSHKESVPLTRKTMAKIALKVAIIDQDFKQFKKNRDLFKRLDEKGQGNLIGPDAELLLKKLGEDAQGNAILEALKDADTNKDGEISYKEFMVAVIKVNIDILVSDKTD